MRKTMIFLLLVLALIAASCGEGDDAAGTSPGDGDSVASTTLPPATTTTPPVTTTEGGTTTTVVSTTTTTTTTTLPPLDAIDGWTHIPVDADLFAGVTIRDGAATDDIMVLAGCARGASTMAQGDDAPIPLWWSADGATWRRASGAEGVHCVREIEATALGFFAAGDFGLLQSSDGAAWEQVEMHTLFGFEQAGQLGSPRAVFASPDDDRVTLLYSRAAEAESTVATLVTTTDGVSWTTGPEASAALFDSSDVADVIRGGDGLLAVGASPGGEFVPTAAVFTSADGLAWRRVTPTTSDFEDKIMTAVAATPNGYVAVGGDFFETGLMTAWTSPDGISWTKAPHPDETTDPNVAHMLAQALTLSGDRIWVAGIDFDARRDDAAHPALWVSTDGTGWERAAFPSGGDVVPFVVIDHGDVRIGVWPPPALLEHNEQGLADDAVYLYLAD